MDKSNFSEKELELLKYYKLDNLENNYPARILYNTALELAKIKGETTGQYFNSVKSCIQEVNREGTTKTAGYLDSLISIPIKNAPK